MGVMKSIATRGRRGTGTKNISFEGADELRKNLMAIGADLSKIRAVFVAIDYNIAPHAHFVEFGGRGGALPARPFFRNTVSRYAKDSFEVSYKTLTDIIEGKRIENPQRALLRSAEYLAARVRMAAPIAKKGHWRKKKWLAPGGLKSAIVAKVFT